MAINNEEEFYREVISRLIRLDLNDIAIVKTELFELGRMTKKGKLSDKKELGKPQSQLKEAKRLVKEINKFLSDSSTGNDFTSEYEKFKLKQQRNSLQERLKQLNQAQRIAEIKELDKHLQEAFQYHEQLHELEKPELREVERQYGYYKERPRNLRYYKEQMKKWRTAGLFSLLIAAATALLVLLNPIYLLIPLMGFLVSFYFFGQERSTHKEMYSENRMVNEILSTARAFSFPSESFDELESYLMKIKIEKDRLTKNRDQKGAILKNHYEKERTDKFSLESFAFYLREQMNSLDMNLNLVYSKDEFERTYDALSSINKEIEDLEEKEKGLLQKIQEFATKTNQFSFEGILKRSFELQINSIESLERFAESLEELINKIEYDKKISEETNMILDRIFQTETEKIAKYLNEETLISDLATKITMGLFKQIRYNAETSSFLIVRKGDLEQVVDQLSRAELSQLYFAIRLALGTKCMDHGFLIMEDPFLPSDNERLDEEIKILKKFVEEGWQIILFTAKEYLKAKLIENGGKLIKELERLP
ncbi:MAG: ATP-binding protein [Candidatus Heimdallarchaeota archaeon]